MIVWGQSKKTERWTAMISCFSKQRQNLAVCNCTYLQRGSPPTHTPSPGSKHREILIHTSVYPGIVFHISRDEISFLKRLSRVLQEMCLDWCCRTQNSCSSSKLAQGNLLLHWENSKEKTKGIWKCNWRGLSADGRNGRHNLYGRSTIKGRTH